MSSHGLRPTKLEVACNLVLGSASVTAAGAEPIGPLDALERAMIPALCRPPCLVSFSGGRDSSAVLAVATQVARREHLPLPVPVTLRFPGVAAADESCWQELVIDSLGLADWQRNEVINDELEFLGPWATSVLRRHGLLYPANTAFHLPLMGLAPRGSLLTGYGGDHLFEWRWGRVADVLALPTHARPRDVLRVAYALAPRAVRRAAERRGAPQLPWLTRAGRLALRTTWANERASEPRHWGRRTAWEASRRMLAATCWSLDLIARDLGVQVHHPLLEPAFVSALARLGGRTGLGDRTSVMRALFGDVLPPAIIARRDRGNFGQAFWGRRVRAFADCWDGRGLMNEFVDVAALRGLWRAGPPPFNSALLLQAAWLGSAPDGPQEELDDARERSPVPGNS